MTTQLGSVRQFQETVWTIETYRSSLSGKNLDTESPGLDYGSSGQVGAAKSAGETEVVFDAARHTCLPSGRFTFDHHCSQALAGSVDGCRKSRWTTADDCQIIECFRRACLESDVLSKFRQRGPSQA